MLGRQETWAIQYRQAERCLYNQITVAIETTEAGFPGIVSRDQKGRPMEREPDLQELLQRGIAAAKAAQKHPSPQFDPVYDQPGPPWDIVKSHKDEARRLLLQVTELDETNVQAWLWLSAVMDELIDKYTCLENVLALEPHNQAAQAGLRKITRQVTLAEAQQNLRRAPSLPQERLQAPARQVNMGRLARLWADGRYQDSFADDYAPDIPGEHRWYQSPEPPEPPPAATLPAPPQATCPFCDKPLASMEMSCRRCGLSLVMDCPKCNTLMDVEHRHCTHCGHDMGDYRLGPLYFTQLAADYQRHKRPPKALAALQQAEKLDPKLPDLYRQLGEVLAELGQTRTAVETLQRAIQREPKQIGPYLTLGKIFQQEGQWEQAERLYGQALKISPKSSDAHLALGDLCLQRSQVNQARRHLQQATQLNSRNGLAWMRLGQLYDSLNKRGPAARAYGQAYQSLPRDRPEWHRVQARLQRLDPRLPQRLAQGWEELARRITGPILLCFLILLAGASFRPWLIDLTGWLVLLLAMAGAILWVSGASLPKNPLARLLAGQSGLEESPVLRFLMAAIGAICWLLALGLALWSLSQALPELPGLPF